MPKRKGIDQTNSYRLCFSTDSGKRVLGHLLAEAGLFDTDLKTTEELAVENFAKKILKNMGIYDLDSVESYVNQLFQLPSR